MNEDSFWVGYNQFADLSDDYNPNPLGGSGNLQTYILRKCKFLQ